MIWSIEARLQSPQTNTSLPALVAQEVKGGLKQQFPLMGNGSHTVLSNSLVCSCFSTHKWGGHKSADQTCYCQDTMEADVVLHVAMLQLLYASCEKAPSGETKHSDGVKSVV